MAEPKKSSCLRRTLAGCGCSFVILLGVGAVLALLAHLNQPDEPEFETVIHDQFIGDREATTLQFPQQGETESVKPVRLYLDVSMANLLIIPDSEPGRFLIDAEFDQANFELDSQFMEGREQDRYTIRFNPKQKVGHLLNDYHGPNYIRLHIPRNLPLVMETELAMGRGEIDVSGVPILGFSTKVNMSELTIRKSDPNPLVMRQPMDMHFNMGQLILHDLQNYRFEEARYEFSMSEARLYNSGSFSQASEFDLSVAMGEILLQLPDDAQLDASVTAFMGGYQGPHHAKGTNQGVSIRLKGEAKMGAIQVETGTSKPWISTAMMGVLRSDGIEAAIDLYRKSKKNTRKDYVFHSNALRRLGIQLLDQKRPEDAIAILELNLEEFPQEPRSYYTLAKVLYRQKAYEPALSLLDRALQIDHQYRPARELREAIQEVVELDEP